MMIFKEISFQLLDQARTKEQLVDRPSIQKALFFSCRRTDISFPH
jgi:hypothetical protein